MQPDKNILKGCHKFEQFKTRNEFFLKSMDLIDASDFNLNAIKGCCNEPLISHFIFNGEDYSTEGAKGFIEWGKKGWEKNEYFVYVITDSLGKIVGAINIKSSHLEKAEIGYWISENTRGLATNVLNRLIDLAEKAGFQSLYAEVSKDNTRSIKLLERCRFMESRDGIDRSNSSDRFYQINL